MTAITNKCFVVIKFVLDMINSINLKKRAKASIMILLPMAIITMTVLTCQDNDPVPSLSYALSTVAAEKTPAKKEVAFAPMPGDTIYKPLAWGSKLRVVKNVIFKSKYKNKDYWFFQSFAFSRITPANYQQDSIRERVVLADSIMVSQYDTFYICRRIIY